jgi:hypothetical protein
MCLDFGKIQQKKRWGMAPRLTITQKHIKFVNEYMDCGDAYEAARRAGVKENALDSTVERWQSHPTIIAMVEQKKLERLAKESVDSGWIIGQLKQMYAQAKDDGDNGNALKALDMLGKHVGLYAADKGSGVEQPITVMITNYSDNKEKMIKDVGGIDI